MSLYGIQGHVFYEDDNVWTARHIPLGERITKIQDGIDGELKTSTNLTNVVVTNTKVVVELSDINIDNFSSSFYKLIRVTVYVEVQEKFNGKLRSKDYTSVTGTLSVHEIRQAENIWIKYEHM